MARKKLTKKQQKQIKKFAIANWKVLIVIFLLFVCLAVVAYYQGWLNFLFDDEEVPEFKSTAGGYVTTVDSFKDMRVTFLDVGQGDCIIIELPDGKNMIIDSGDTSSEVEKSISDFTKSRNITVFDYVLLTHTDEDHVGNMDWVFENYICGFVFMPNVNSTHAKAGTLEDGINPEYVKGGKKVDTLCYYDFLKAVDDENCYMEIFNRNSDFANTITCGDIAKQYVFDFLTPTALRSEIAYSIANNYSPLMTLEYGGKKIMFTGDAQTDVLSEFINAYGSEDNNIDILKVGHHGAINATTAEFISEIDPEYAVIQCGQGNGYGHPEKDVLNILKSHDSNMKIYRNDTNGNITVSIRVDGNISWDFENSDMSYNMTCGDDLKNIVISYYSPESDVISDILENLEVVPSKEFAVA